MLETEFEFLAFGGLSATYVPAKSRQLWTMCSDS